MHSTVLFIDKQREENVLDLRNMKRKKEKKKKNNPHRRIIAVILAVGCFKYYSTNLLANNIIREPYN